MREGWCFRRCSLRTAREREFPELRGLCSVAFLCAVFPAGGGEYSRKFPDSRLILNQDSRQTAAPNQMPLRRTQAL